MNNQGYTIKQTAPNAIYLEWDESEKAEAIAEIDQILTMKVGPRCPKNEIYWQVNDYCNTLPFNESYSFLFKKCKQKFANINNIDEIIDTVLD